MQPVQFSRVTEIVSGTSHYFKRSQSPPHMESITRGEKKGRGLSQREGEQSSYLHVVSVLPLLKNSSKPLAWRKSRTQSELSPFC